jgi:hypothetical protein
LPAELLEAFAGDMCCFEGVVWEKQTAARYYPNTGLQSGFNVTVKLPFDFLWRDLRG